MTPSTETGPDEPDVKDAAGRDPLDSANDPDAVEVSPPDPFRVGATVLVMEIVVLVLAIQPILIFGGSRKAWGVGAVVALIVLTVFAVRALRRPWGWPAVFGLQALMVLAGLLHWSLAVIGLLFALVWWYAMHVRKVVSRPRETTG